ncbi:MAG: hypothetical protein A3H91_01660 [Gammaproteobacteria bacterium RIFCSPLOWO2_02_FULL_61_13]|nr:MAG: hypothetical protein A3H91_01660 [Gammaproteobacteria bacterium RIFCSPLOWO2_02_FULL_61_13]
MRENALLSLHRRCPGDPVLHDYSIIGSGPNENWGTDRIRIETERRIADPQFLANLLNRGLRLIPEFAMGKTVCKIGSTGGTCGWKVK